MLSTHPSPQCIGRLNRGLSSASVSVNSARSAASVLIPFPSLDSQLSTVNFQPPSSRRSDVQTSKPANVPQSAPPPIPILGLTSPSSQKKLSLSFHALTNCPFCNPFVLMVFHLMGGVYTPPPARKRKHS
jgi:hypothetical protein